MSSCVSTPDSHFRNASEQVLNAREPKIVNGPEILDKYVGGSEEKIRALFADAEKEQVRAKLAVLIAAPPRPQWRRGPT